jgi:hypothetical protein
MIKDKNCDKLGSSKALEVLLIDGGLCNCGLLVGR